MVTAQSIHKTYIIASVLEKDNIWNTPHSDTAGDMLQDKVSVVARMRN